MLKRDYRSFSDLFSDYLNLFNYLNMKWLRFVGVLPIQKFESVKLRILEILNFHPSKYQIKIRPEFYYELIYEPSYCNFAESRKKIKFNF